MNCHVQGPACSMQPIPYLPVLRLWIGAGQVEAPGRYCRLPSVLNLLAAATPTAARLRRWAGAVGGGHTAWDQCA
jgi:hypothetical protein